MEHNLDLWPPLWGRDWRVMNSADSFPMSRMKLAIRSVCSSDGHRRVDLAGYFQHEFSVALPEWGSKLWKPIRFWDDVATWRDV
jgi:hypothetical protein